LQVHSDKGVQPTFGLAIWWLDVVTSAFYRYQQRFRLTFFNLAFVVNFTFCIFIGLRFRADVFQIPPHRQAVNVWLKRYSTFLYV
jgi:hypothetical protein